MSETAAGHGRASNDECRKPQVHEHEIHKFRKGPIAYHMFAQTDMAYLEGIERRKILHVHRYEITFQGGISGSAHLKPIKKGQMGCIKSFGYMNAFLPKNYLDTIQ